jgi:hypothetical protein
MSVVLPQPIDTSRKSLSLLGPSVSWHKIGMRVGSKAILRDVSGSVAGGAVCAVMVCMCHELPTYHITYPPPLPQMLY